MKFLQKSLFFGVVFSTFSLWASYPIVDTGVSTFFNNFRQIDEPKSGERFYGQDAHYQGNQPNYTDNQDGTITDNVTGLMWAKSVDKKRSFQDALSYAKTAKIGGYDDWRLPTIKELYSLILFTGNARGTKAGSKLYIDTEYFNQPIGDIAKGEREIDAQVWSSTQYVGRTMRNDRTVFGVNFIDGRIKGYSMFNLKKRAPQMMYARLVRGNTDYGQNNFIDNGDGTITDLSTNLMWQKADSNKAMNWEDALAYAENLTFANHEDWRLPNAKELQSIVDYTRSLQTTNSAAIDPLFETTKIKDMNGELQYPYFWSSTTHVDSAAVYIAFGEAKGLMNGQLLDVHGAGSQRSDAKSGSHKDYPKAFGPQGDIQMVYNYVRAVRSIKNASENEIEQEIN